MKVSSLHKGVTGSRQGGSAIIAILAVTFVALGCGGQDDGTREQQVAGAGGGSSGAMASGSGGLAIVGSAGGTEGGGASATFTRVFDEIIRGTGCNGGGLCHGGAMSVSTLTMRLQDQAYAALVDVPAMSMNLTGMGTHCAGSGTLRVVPGDPDRSLFVQKLEGTQRCGDPMPPATERLAPEQIQLVRDWIQNGAPND